MRYGAAPKILGHVKLDCPEIMHVQYMPILIPDQGYRIPKNLQWVEPLIDIVWKNFQDYILSDDIYMYLTVKHGWVDKGSIPNRPGWHCDGFMSDDINFIWYDSVPTEFCIQDFDLTQDHDKSMMQMQQQARNENIVTYPYENLIMMDQSVVHRVGVAEQSAWRTFIKVSLSKDKYNLKGNAHNYLFDYNWEMYQRSTIRNHPTKEDV